MSTIPKQNLVIDDTIDIGLTADLINGTYKTSSLTDLSNNVYSKISDLSSNVYTALGTKQANLTSTTNLLGIGTSITALNYNNISLNKPDLSVYALNNSLNASNITSGTLSISRGGIGTSTLTANQILIGNAATSILQSANLSWDNTTNTLSATNFIGSGSGISALNASNITSGTLSISRGGIGTATLTANQLLIGNAATSILQSANLSWNNTSNTLSATNFIGSGSGISALNVSNAASGTLSISRGGIGTATLTANQILIGNAATSILQSANLSWNNTSNTLSATNFIGSGSGISALNVSNAASGTLSISRGGIGTATLTANQILIGNAATSILQSANLSWNNTSNTLSATNFIGSGSGITNLDYGNISTNKPNLAIYQPLITVSTPLVKDVSNNITIDLSAYPLKTYVDGSLNTINTTLSNKQNLITVSTPLVKDVNNNITIDLSAYPLKTYVDGSLNTINTTLSNKQNNLTFSNPFLNTLNTITLKYNSSQFNIDSNGNLSLSSTTSYLPLAGGTLTGTLIVNSNPPNIQLNTTNNYNIGIATGNGYFSTSAVTNDLIIRSGGNLLLQNGQGVYAFKIGTNNYCYVNKRLSIDCVPADNKATVEAAIIANVPTLTTVFSGDSIWTGYWGCAINVNAGGVANGFGSGDAGQTYVTGYSAFTVNMRSSTSQTTFDRRLFTIMPDGNITTLGNIDCGGGITLNGANATANITAVDSGNYSNTYLTLKPSISNDDWCYIRQIGSNNAYKLAFDFHDDGDDARFCIRSVQSTAAPDTIKEVFTVDNGKVYITDTTQIIPNSSTYDALNLYCYPVAITNQNGANRQMNMNIVCNTSGFAKSTFLNCVVADGWNGINTILTLGCDGAAYSGYNFASRIILDGSFATNSSKGSYGNTIKFQSQSATGWTDNITISNGKLGIGTTDPQTLLDVRGTIYIKGSVNVAAPTTGNYGGNGDRIVLWNGSSTSHPYALGIDGGTLWYSVPSGASHKFYIGGGEIIRFNSTGMGFGNTNPQSFLHLGNCDVAGSAPILFFGKRLSNNSGFRTAFLGYDDSFFFSIGDAGSVNSSVVINQQFAIAYSAPVLSFLISGTGFCTMQYGHTGASDERIKTNIRTIENALDKTLLLRGVNYNDIRIDPDQLRMGLIAQEVELIIPEVVHTDENTTMKSIEYQNIVGLLVEAIKELNNKVSNLENIIKKNNLN